MPIHEFRCPEGHITEKLFLTLAEAERTKKIKCMRSLISITNSEAIGTEDYPCQLTAVKITSAGAFILGGSPGGWEKPSPSAKRIVNPDAISFTGEGDYFK